MRRGRQNKPLRVRVVRRKEIRKSQADHSIPKSGLTKPGIARRSMSTYFANLDRASRIPVTIFQKAGPNLKEFLPSWYVREQYQGSMRLAFSI